MMEMLSILVAAAIGSIPFGLLITRYAGLGDIREIGSGNIGATNVLRTGNKKLALITLVLDAMKGVVAVVLAAYVFDSTPALSALAAVIAHCFCPWLRFKGGKGVATTLGALLALSFPAGLLVCALWAAFFFLTRISSLSALASLGIAPFVMWFATDAITGTLALIITCVVYWRHRPNIERLMQGTEPRFTNSAPPAKE